MSYNNIKFLSQVRMDDAELGTDFDILGLSPAKLKYQFVAICDSDLCHLRYKLENPGNRKRRDHTGFVRDVAKSVDVCPLCGSYLMWERKAI